MRHTSGYTQTNAMSKGSKRRPCQIDNETLEANWSKVFGHVYNRVRATENHDKTKTSTTPQGRENNKP